MQTTKNVPRVNVTKSDGELKLSPPKVTTGDLTWCKHIDTSASSGSQVNLQLQTPNRTRTHSAPEVQGAVQMLEWRRYL